MKKKAGIILLLFCVIFVVACNKKEDPTDIDQEETDDIDQTIEPSEEVTEESNEIIPDGYAKSRLTGLYVPGDVATSRPYAIMISNIKVVNPQSGTEEASILYESLVEGGITRHMGVFEEFHPERIGSVRSGRQYFASIADEYDAVLVSFGESSYCTEKIKELNLNQLSGLRGEGSTVFYRDNSIKAPHNAFTSKEGLAKGIAKKEFRTAYDEKLINHFSFYNTDTDLLGDQNVNKLTLKFSSYTSPYFTYDAENKTYLRFQHGGAHIDANSSKQLEFKNIIVQFVDGFSIDETKSFSFKQADGEGYYISNGKAVPITWDKKESDRSMAYYDSNKNMLEINPGKTYIAIFPGSRTSDVIFE